MAMKLYTYFRSSAAFRVRIALNLKGIAYEAAPVHLLKGEQNEPRYMQHNPQGLVPALEDGEQLILQSGAIIEYLEETHPAPPLLPTDAAGRARVRALSQLIACEIHPLNNLRTLKYLRKHLGQDDDGINAWYRHWVADGLGKFERSLAETAGTAAFCHGDAPGMADCHLVPQIFNAQRYQCDLAPFPITMGVFGRCVALEAFRKAEPSQQPDAN
jgi:maleylacetoacetate isomerase/maleylpyruvate isomerase